MLSFGRQILANARRMPDQPAITFEDRTVTWDHLEQRTNRLARAYQELGVCQDDIVTVALPNSNEFLEACIALWKLGATPQPVSSRMPPAELLDILALARPRLILGLDQAAWPECRTLPCGFKPATTLSPEPLPDAIAKHWKICASGGSTGRPKLIVDGQPSCGELVLPRLLGQLPDRVQLVPGPLHHNAPFVSAVSGLLDGNQIVVMKSFDAENVLRLIERFRVDWMMIVPTMMHRIWRLEPEIRSGYNVGSLRIVYHAAAPCPIWLKEEWISWLGPDRIIELYGGTEGQGATLITGREWLENKGSVGKPIPGCSVGVFDDMGRRVAANTVGEIYFRSDPEKPAPYYYIGAEARSRPGGWESLGDMGYFNEGGYLFLCDRRDDLIISGGKKIYPAEVEAAIDAHAAVRSSIVVGFPDEDRGKSVHAFVDAPLGVTAEELLEHLVTRIERYKLPRTIEFVNGPLRDDAGKVRRSLLTAVPDED